MSKMIGIVLRDATLRARVVQTLQGAGARTVESDAALDALNWLQDEHIDAMVVDLHLEDMHGDDLVREVRGEPAGLALPVVMMIDHDDEWFVERCEQAGASAIVPYADAPSIARILAGLFRIDARIETSGRLQYYIVESSAKTRYNGRVDDVSASGIAFHTDQCELEAGFVVDTRVALPDLDTFMARAEVVRVMPPDARGIYRVFLKWRGFRKGDRPRLVQWIRERSASR